jgi:hypothetical protein
MSSRGAFTLAESAAKLTMLEVACSRCERRGRLSLARDGAASSSAKGRRDR